MNPLNKKSPPKKKTQPDKKPPAKPTFKLTILKPHHKDGWIVTIPHFTYSSVYLYNSYNTCIATISLPYNTPYVNISSPAAIYAILEYAYEPLPPHL